MPDASQLPRLVVDGTNALRRGQGLHEVKPEARLTQAAREFAQFMARTDRFEHDADGRHPQDRARAQGYDYCLVSENIGFEFDSRGFATRELARDFVEGWKHSPAHRRNMEEPDVVDIGVAVARSAKTGRYYGVQMFGRPARLGVRFSVENRSRAAVEYRIGERQFPLPPRVVRTHRECVPGDVSFAGRAVRAADGDRFIVVQERGRLALERE